MYFVFICNLFIDSFVLYNTRTKKNSWDSWNFVDVINLFFMATSILLSQMIFF